MADIKSVVGTLVVKQEVDNTDYNQKMDSAVEKADKSANAIKKILAFAGVSYLFSGAKEAALEADKAAFQFNQTLQRTGVTQGQADALKDYAENASKQFGIARTEIEGATAALLKMSGSATATMKLQKNLADISTGMGIATGDAAMMMNRVLSGGIENVKRFGIEATDEMIETWDTFGDDIEAKADYLSDLLEGKFKGSAEAFGNTAAGQMQNITNQFNDLKLELGKSLMPVLITTSNMLLGIIKILGGVPGLIGAISAAMVAYKAIQFTLMSTEEKKTAGLIAKWVGIAIAKAWAINPFLGIFTATALPLAIGGVMAGITALIGAVSKPPEFDASNPVNTEALTNKENSAKKETPKEIIEIVMVQNEFGDWEQRQITRNGVSDNVTYNK